ncbi:MAG: methyltransferase [Desulfobacteraceae bacterium]|nr:methyltransferase [Desulfobacteraceae bacterium]
MFSIDRFHAEYETTIEELLIHDKRFRFHVPASIDRFLDADDALKDFPLWAKMWEASVILSNFLSKMPALPDEKMLELGAGLGVVGIVAAAFGHKVTMTEYNTDALNFAHANAELNNSENITIAALDWNNPAVDGEFDVIIGSEITFNKNNFNNIYKLLRRYLKSDGRAILAEGMRASGLEFYKTMSAHFDIKARKTIMRSADQEIPNVLMQMNWKNKEH